MGEHLVKKGNVWVTDNEKNTLPAGMATKEYPVEPRMNLSDRPGTLYDEGHPNQGQWDKQAESKLSFRTEEDDGYHD
jgi:hypothetical protein